MLPAAVGFGKRAPARPRVSGKAEPAVVTRAAKNRWSEPGTALVSGSRV
jgi:hypothetical protein